LKIFSLFLFLAILIQADINNPDFTICRIKYNGGGDWYNDRSIIPNMLKELQKRTKIPCQEEQAVATLEDNRIFYYPFIFMTGHGNVIFSESEIKNLRKYLFNGGFLYIDDDYGMDKAIRREIKKAFPDKKFVKVPFSHPIYNCFYKFPQGLPKIHKHDGKPPEGWGIFHNGRLILFYTYETNISDGWADPNVHKDPEYKREQAFKMGVNIIYYALTN